jgi:hypothetical protein
MAWMQNELPFISVLSSSNVSCTFDGLWGEGRREGKGREGRDDSTLQANAHLTAVPTVKIRRYSAARTAAV